MARELTALGELPRIEDGGVSWEGDARSLMRANLWLRTASRVLVRVATFKATAFYELERRAKKIPWGQFLARGAVAEFRVTARKSRLYHSDAIAERLRRAAARPPTTKAVRSELTTHRSQLFVVRVVKDEFHISADSSGELLHIRGYRQAVAKAPLRETLAAALLIGSDWTGDVPLLDPFCGSGTIPIEGAMLARRIAPGLHRRFVFMEWPGYDESAWLDLTARARAQVLSRSPASIMGSDRDIGAVEAARANAERAGVEADITFSTHSISGIDPPSSAGLIATNPPYGVRVGKQSNVRNLYAQFGHVLRSRCQGWRVAMYSADSPLTAETGLPLTTAFGTSNGGIRVAAMVGTVTG